MRPNEKQQVVAETTDSLRGVRGIYLADFTGMTVESLSALRKKCRQEQVQFRVIKNTLLKRAFNGQGITDLDRFLVGPTGVVFSANSEMSPARILSEFAKVNERPRIKAAVVDGRLFDEKEIARLAALPSREVLLSQVLGTLLAPMTTVLAAIEALLRAPASLADALEAKQSPNA